MPHTPLSNAEILKAIERQAHLSAIDGMFIKSPAQHGEVSRGHLELGSSSRLKKYEDGAAVGSFHAARWRIAGVAMDCCWRWRLSAWDSRLVALLVGIARFFGSGDASPVIGRAINTAGVFVPPYH